MQKLLSVVTIGAAFLIIQASAALAVEFSRARTLEDAHKASCRVSVSSARGTGTFIGYDEEHARCLVLTNYHVVTRNTDCVLDFWTNSVRQSVKGRVVARFYDARKPYDFALIEVNPNDLKRIDPPYVALAGKGATPDANSFILSAGCPKGRFVQAWKGKVLGYYGGITVEFQPGPVPGQSGSGVLSVVDDELFLTAVLTWLIGTEGADSSKGGAIPVANLYDALRGSSLSTVDDFDSDFLPIPPGAVECAMPRPYVVEYVGDNCRACDIAEADVKKIRDAGIDIRQVNTSKDKKAASIHGVTLVPTFIVYDSAGNEVARYLGAHKASAIIADVEHTEAKEDDARRSNLPVIQDPAIQAENLQEDFNDKLFSIDPQAEEQVELLSEQGSSDDFRNRPPVYDYGPLDNPSSVGFFDDADALWRNRGNRRSPQPEDPYAPDTPDERIAPQNPPKDEQQPPLDEERLGLRLGDRLANRFGSAFDAKMKEALNALDEKIDQTISTVENKADARIAEAKLEAKSYMKEVYNAWKWRIICAFFGAIIFGVIIGEVVKKATKVAWERLWNWLTVIPEHFMYYYYPSMENEEDAVPPGTEPVVKPVTVLEKKEPATKKKTAKTEGEEQ